MADKILVNTEEMLAAITKYENARSILDEAFTKLQGAKEHLDRCYAGPDYLALVAKYMDTYANIKTAENAVESAVQGLRKTIDTMETSENAIGGRAAALEAGSAPTVFMS